jgi:hypothetical protein
MKIFLEMAYTSEETFFMCLQSEVKYPVCFINNKNDRFKYNRINVIFSVSVKFVRSNKYGECHYGGHYQCYG